MLLKRYSFCLSSLLLMPLLSLPGSLLANTSEQIVSEQANTNEDVPSEEFWLYMAEFAEDEELMDSAALMNERQLNPESIKINSEVKSSEAAKLAESGEESL
ncbi:MAG: hypothetical protein IPK77_10760 [Cellvibrio sp.]|nr:hypothetical protein [Cellvibrio sp.]